jgi:hypothetical protein
MKVVEGIRIVTGSPSIKEANAYQRGFLVEEDFRDDLLQVM